VRRTSPRRSVRQNEAPEWAVTLAAGLRDIALQVGALTAEMTRLRLLLGPEDAVDTALLTIVAAKVGADTFSARELWDHAEYDHILGSALAAADVSNARQIGWLLARCEGSLIEDHLKLGRDGEDSSGVVWVFRVCPAKPIRGDTDVCHD